MSIVNFIKNNFLGIIILGFFLLPSVVMADNNLIDYKGGAYYNDNTWQNRGDGTADNTLYSKDQTEGGYWVDNNKISVLGNKLNDAGSTFDVSELNQNNTYSVNSPNNSIFYHDPTPENKTNNDTVLLGVATVKGQLYLPPTPISKESVQANDFLNNVDQKQGLPVGTTVGIKNEEFNAAQIKIGDQAEYDRLNKIATEAEAALTAAQTSYQQPGSTVTPEQITAISKAAEEARLAANNQGRVVWGAGTNLAQIQAQRATTGTSQTETNLGCESTWTNPAKPIGTFFCIGVTISKVTNIIFKLVSFIAYMVGTGFDYSLELSMNSAEMIKALGVVEITWSFIRDILNMSFIFILLWTAIKILLGDEKYNAKKVLTSVVIVAILMNFSLFAAKLMVDGSNIVALKLYEAMKATSAVETQASSISVRVMNTVGLTTLYDVSKIFNDDALQTQAACVNNPGGMITIAVMGSIFLIILCLALGLAAILFLIRLVNIIFLFIKSPLWVWGHVLPGNAMVTKFKDEWWAEMKHVIVFPIVYLFWMLIAIIVFEKLGTVKSVVGGGTSTQPRTLLDLICSAPGTSGFGDSIALVAIFAIVIIFMMMAIKYAMKSASSPNMIGGGFADSMSKKFAGYQTAMTKGLAKKAGSLSMSAGSGAIGLVGGASIGAAKHGLLLGGRTAGRFAGSAMGGIQGGVNGKGVWEGMKDGFFDPGLKTKELLRNAGRATAAGTANNGLANALGITTMAAKLASRYDEPKNADGKTKKQVDEERTAKAAKNEEIKYQAIDKQYKIMTQDDWQKKNTSGTPDDYEAYILDKIAKRTDALLGKGTSVQENKDGQRHIDALKDKAITRETDKDGKVKIRFNEQIMHSSLPDIIKHHTTGEGAATHKIDKDKFTTFRNIKSKARIKAITDQSKISQSKARGKKTLEDTTKNYETKIKNLEETIKDLPDMADVELASTNHTVYSGKGDSEKTLRDMNKAILEHNALTSARSPDTASIEQKQREIDAARKKFEAHLNKQKSTLVDQESKYNQHLIKVEESKKDNN